MVSVCNAGEVSKDLEWKGLDKMKDKLMPFQEVGRDFLINNRHTLLGDDMGLGKTIQAIAAINYIWPKRIIIVCPATVTINWVRELTTWLKKPRTIHIVKNRKERLPDANIIIVSYAMLMSNYIRAQINAKECGICICDEAHYLKNLESQRSFNVLGNQGVVRRAIFKIMMTGTPVLNRPIELYPMLKVLASKHIYPYDTYTKFAYRFCDAFEDEHELNAKGASNLEDLNQRLQKFMLRRKKEEVLPDLPPRTYQMIELPFDEDRFGILKDEMMMTKKQKDHYVNGEEDIELATLRRLTGMAKLPQAIAHIENMMTQIDKLILFAYHRDVITELAKALSKYNPVIIRGGMSPEQKQESVDTFMNNSECKIFIGNIDAAGQGIDGLQKVSSNVVFVEPSWVPGKISQAVDRAHRIGQTKPVLVQFLVSTGTIESAMLSSVRYKNSLIRRIVEC